MSPFQKLKWLVKYLLLESYGQGARMTRTKLITTHGTVSGTYLALTRAPGFQITKATF